MLVDFKTKVQSGNVMSKQSLEVGDIKNINFDQISIIGDPETCVSDYEASLSLVKFEQKGKHFVFYLKNRLPVPVPIHNFIEKKYF